jgi:hypothetical protein
VLLRAKTLNEVWEAGCRRMFFGGNDEITKSSGMTLAFNNVLIAKSMEFHADVGRDLNLTQSRFPALLRDYVDLEEYEAFLGRCQNVAKRQTATTQMLFRRVKPRGINKFKPTGNKAHGGCMLAVTFRKGKRGQSPEFGLHSRMSYLPYMGALDATVVYAMAKEVGDLLGFDRNEASFTWYCDSFAFASMQSASYVTVRDDLMAAIDNERKYPGKEYPTIDLMRRTLNVWREKYEVGHDPQTEKYGQLRRYRSRWERIMNDDPLPSIPVDTLTMEPLRRTPRLRAYRMKPHEEVKTAHKAATALVRRLEKVGENELAFLAQELLLASEQRLNGASRADD